MSMRYFLKNFEDKKELLKKIVESKAKVIDYKKWGEYESQKLNVIKIPHNFTLPTSEKGITVPEGFALTGGTFRSYMLEWLGLKYTPIRDLDLIALAHHKPDEHKIQQVIEEFMEDDYSNGHGLKQKELTKTYPRETLQLMKGL